MLQYRTAGESHGRYMLAVVEGLPEGMPVRPDFADEILKRRRTPAGRSSRMSMEDDAVDIISGIYRGRTTGAPVAVLVANRDYRIDKDIPPITAPRPGHADLAGTAKYLLRDARPVAERAGGRETVARCVAGALAGVLLGRFGVDVLGYVVRIATLSPVARVASLERARALRNRSKIYSLAPKHDTAAEKLIESARRSGDTLGGEFAVRAEGVPPGLGSPMQWDERLDARLAAAIVAIPSVKGVEIGGGFSLAGMKGSKAHDAIVPGAGRAKAPRREGNYAGGIEGGMSNGQPIVLRAAVKPVPTTGAPRASVDVRTGKKARTAAERADICVVPAVSVVGEAVVAFEIARAMREKFGGDTLKEMESNFGNYIRALRRLYKKR
ncbi:MAG: chorismate synthase [Planctomycetota bacterium]